jgi:hypothetical protein
MCFAGVSPTEFIHQSSIVSSMKRLLLFFLAAFCLIPTTWAKPIEVIVYSATSWYRHPEIPRVNGYLARLGAKHEINVSITEDAADLSAENLQSYNLKHLFNLGMRINGGRRA